MHGSFLSSNKRFERNFRFLLTWKAWRWSRRQHGAVFCSSHETTFGPEIGGAGQAEKIQGIQLFVWETIPLSMNNNTGMNSVFCVLTSVNLLFPYLVLLEKKQVINVSFIYLFFIVYFPLPFSPLGPPSPCNHHTGVHVHESFFLSAQSLHPSSRGPALNLWACLFCLLVLFIYS